MIRENKQYLIRISDTYYFENEVNKSSIFRRQIDNYYFFYVSLNDRKYIVLRVKIPNLKMNFEMNRDINIDLESMTLDELNSQLDEFESIHQYQDFEYKEQRKKKIYDLKDLIEDMQSKDMEYVPRPKQLIKHQRIPSSILNEHNFVSVAALYDVELSLFLTTNNPREHPIELNILDIIKFKIRGVSKKEIFLLFNCFSKLSHILHRIFIILYDEIDPINIERQTELSNALNRLIQCPRFGKFIAAIHSFLERYFGDIGKILWDILIESIGMELIPNNISYLRSGIEYALRGASYISRNADALRGTLHYIKQSLLFVLM